MRALLIPALAVLLAFGCGPSKKPITDSDRRDAQVILKDMKFPIGAVTYEQEHLNKPSDHLGKLSELTRSFVKQADETRTKFKGTSIESEVSRLCLALTTYWELPDGKDPKAKAAAIEVNQAKIDLQALADGK